MTLSKRERVIRTIEIGGKPPDKLPIFSWGFERTAGSWKHLINTGEYTDLYNKYIKKIEGESDNRRKFSASKMAEGRFLNLDVHPIDPFKKFKGKKTIPGPPDRPNTLYSTLFGRIYEIDNNGHAWYIEGNFNSDEKVNAMWDQYGKPHERLFDDNYSPQVWKNYVEVMSDSFFPLGTIPASFSENIVEGVGTRLAYFLRKKPEFIHKLCKEILKTGIEIINRLSEAGVEVVFFGDDLGGTNRSILSMKHFQEFILPYYKKIYQYVRKKGMLLIQHSCGYIDNFVPLMADAGLHCIQSLQKTAGVDLAHMVETLGDKIAFMGALDDSRILKFGTKKEIEEDVKNCIKIAGQNGNYGPGPSNSILEPPWENLLAMRDALEKYREYPLKF